MVGSALVLWIAIAGLAMMVAGPGAAKKVFSKPVKVIGGLITDLVAGILRFAFDLLGQGLRALGRPIDRGARRLLGLPPPSPKRRQKPRRPEQDDDGDDDA